MIFITIHSRRYIYGVKREQEIYMEALFVNSSFRVSSTWLWAKLRAIPNVTAYYEFFSESLSGLNARSAGGLDYSNEGWKSKHPPSSPYFLEFLPLLREEGGIAGYDACMATDTFMPVGGFEGVLRDDESQYVQTLIVSAQRNKTLPVLTCTRSLGRSLALKKQFDCKSIFLLRNLFHQWASYSSQYEAGNSYFINTIDMTVHGSKHIPFFRILNEWFSERKSSPDDEDLFQVFLLTHLYLYAHNYDVSDVIVNVTDIFTNKDTRKKKEAELSSLFNHEIDLSDVKMNFEYSPLQIRSMNVLTDSIDQFMKMIAGEPNLSRESIDFIQRLKLETFEEIERHEFFLRGARSVHTHRFMQIGQSVSQQTSLAEAAAGERNQLSARLAQAHEALAALRASSAATAHEHDALATRLAEAEGARDSLSSGLAETAQALQAMTASRTQTVQERDELAARLAEAVGVREALSARLNEVSGELSAMKASCAVATQEQGALARRLADVEAARTGLQARLVETAAGLNAALAAKDLEIQTLRANGEALQRQARDFEASTSWKITAPMRRLMTIFR